MYGSGNMGVGVGDIFDDINRAVDAARKAASTVTDIRQGDKQVVVVPTGQGVMQAASSVPWVPLLLGAAAIFLLPKLLR